MVAPKQILLDFDAVMVRNEYPMLGAEVPDAVRVVLRLQQAGHILILYTMRVDDLLADAKKWLDDRGIKIAYYNMNPMYETGSRKIYGHLIIDDKAANIPLVRYNDDERRKPFVNWGAMEKYLERWGYFYPIYK